jgi:hypothetical protein
MSDHEIERIAEYDDGEKVWRTSCKCMGDDNLTFTVATDDECPEVYLEFYVDVGDSYHVWSEEKPFRWLKCMWARFKIIYKLITKGYIEMNASFLFRGEEHIDAVTETIQAHKNYMIERRKTAPYKAVDSHYVINEGVEDEPEDTN